MKNTEKMVLKITLTHTLNGQTSNEFYLQNSGQYNDKKMVISFTLLSCPNFDLIIREAE